MILISVWSLSILFFFFVRKTMIKYHQVQRDFLIHANQKNKTNPISCGGIVFFLSYICYVFYHDDLHYSSFVIIGFFLIGLLDDVGKVVKKSHISFLSGQFRLVFEFIIAGLFATTFIFDKGGGKYLINFFSLDVLTQNLFGISLDIGVVNLPIYAGIIILSFIIVGTANATNLTDGQDTLLAKIFLVHLVFMVFSKAIPMNMLQFILPAILAFILFNSKPATIYMGDCGSLFLGAFIAIYYIQAGFEFLLPVTGFVFVFEALSVIIQGTSFRLRGGKKIFKMAPFHHHLELCNISEEKISNFAFVLTIILCMLCIQIT